MPLTLKDKITLTLVLAGLAWALGALAGYLPVPVVNLDHVSATDVAILAAGWVFGCWLFART